MTGGRPGGSLPIPTADRHGPRSVVGHLEEQVVRGVPGLVYYVDDAAEAARRSGWAHGGVRRSVLGPGQGAHTSGPSPTACCAYVDASPLTSTPGVDGQHHGEPAGAGASAVLREQPRTVDQHIGLRYVRGERLSNLRRHAGGHRLDGRELPVKVGEVGGRRIVAVEGVDAEQAVTALPGAVRCRPYEMDSPVACDSRLA